ncbi:MAG: hypothetical protein QOJ51_3502 [Acidobacteriaceae bacterium]|jgi:hypothetical protein|nr:hypothetical protein [Acidobacteriaceae bacterium]MDX6457098.1 hypothetical protein [Acidobacteriaceae bacterium]MEA2260677.1 hypothetical protein [Acidobacteriaceae bacterium]
MPIEVLHDARLSIASIVFATDFSSASRNAGLYAAAIARHFNAELMVIHAFILSQNARDAESLGRIDSAERRHLEEQLRTTAASLVPPGESVRVALLDGEPSEKISGIRRCDPSLSFGHGHSWWRKRRATSHRICGREVSAQGSLPNHHGGAESTGAEPDSDILPLALCDRLLRDGLARSTVSVRDGAYIFKRS